MVPAYKRGDRNALTEISDVLLPFLKEKTVILHAAHKALWFDRLKVIGWANMDVRYGGMAARCDTAKMLIDRYLDGKDTVIEELEETRLTKPLRGFVHYSAIVTPNIKI